jgi:GTP cyclohydrolase I
MDKKKIIDGVRLILEGIGENPEREGLKRTPQRVYEMYREIFDGLKAKPERELKFYTTPNKDELVIVRDIPFFSMCEHHLLPFFGKVHIAYIPQRNQITGFSSLVRVVEMLSHRPTIQEKLTSDIADIIYKKLDAKGLLIIIEAEHLCMTMIGVRKPGARTTTSAVRGILREDATRAEAMALIKH